MNTGERGCYRAKKSEKLAPQAFGIDFLVNSSFFIIPVKIIRSFHQKVASGNCPPYK
jgi:hypothetical protein